MRGFIQDVFSDYIKGILAKYGNYKELDLTTPIGFPGLVAGERRTVFTPPIESDALLFGANVDFDNAEVTVKITDASSGYVWNPQNFTPISAIAGIQTQVTPVLPLVCPFFLSRQSKLEFEFVNGTTTQVTGGNITYRGVKLLS
jgi:hypothetical protein